MPASQTKNRHLLYIVHLPNPARESNATRIANGGRTLIWDHPLAGALKAPHTIHFKATAPLPRWLVASLGGSAVLTAVLLGLGLRMWRLKWQIRASSGR